MATELGQAYVQIMPSAKGISGAIQNAISPEASAAGKSAGSTLGSTLVKAVTGVIAAAGIGKAFTSALSEGAALQQSLGGIETLFKGSADKVKAYANEAYRTTGLSANAYMENVTGFSASLLQSLGGDTEKLQMWLIWPWLICLIMPTKWVHLWIVFKMPIKDLLSKTIPC